MGQTNFSGFSSINQTESSGHWGCKQTRIAESSDCASRPTLASHPLRHTGHVAVQNDLTYSFGHRPSCHWTKMTHGPVVTPFAVFVTLYGNDATFRQGRSGKSRCRISTVGSSTITQTKVTTGLTGSYWTRFQTTRFPSPQMNAYGIVLTGGPFLQTTICYGQ